MKIPLERNFLERNFFSLLLFYFSPNENRERFRLKGLAGKKLKIQEDERLAVSKYLKPPYSKHGEEKNGRVPPVITESRTPLDTKGPFAKKEWGGEKSRASPHFFTDSFGREKETYIYCQIGTKLLTSLSGDPLNPGRRSRYGRECAAKYTHYKHNNDEDNYL
ncbi:hypothetical protein FTO70_00480 [Methanosarcina sp. KYL-1]|uniref:hypothetical protein n=1 Tax=Methanosarcina sp. KYL-1 TaxID=2602068 RepID=UPI00210151AA|nr:hypothetical protein [Methanosarcina sp. KYL-1]MCQ1534195.1 hypothetical protein [Methanosarcina sp. KYL-1]